MDAPCPMAKVLLIERLVMKDDKSDRDGCRVQVWGSARVGFHLPMGLSFWGGSGSLPRSYFIHLILSWPSGLGNLRRNLASVTSADRDVSADLAPSMAQIV